MKKGLTILTGLFATGLLLTGCGSHPVHHHKSSHPKTTSVKRVRHKTMNTKKHGKHTPKVNKKDMNKAGISDSDIKKDSRAVHQKKSTQPVD